MDEKLLAEKVHRNVWIVSLTSFLTDVSSEMIVNTLPLFLKNVLGVKTAVIGLIEGVAESTASLLKVFSGWLSDRLRLRKWLAVAGYAISTLSKPIFYFAGSWPAVAGARWADRVGKGVRTAPRDALVADSVSATRRGFVFGLNRAADTAGAFLGLIIAWLAIWLLQGGAATLLARTFRWLVLLSLIPAVIAVLVLALGARDVPIVGNGTRPHFGFRSLGRSFSRLLIIVAIFELGNSADAFLVLRAQERGLSVAGIFAMLIAFNFVYALIAVPAGRLSDRLGRKRIIAAGWAVYGTVYLGMALARSVPAVVLLYVLYGAYYGLAYGTTKALVADIVAPAVRGTAFGTYNAVLGIMDFPASLIAGLLWNGLGSWPGFGPAAPFFFGAGMALLALVLFLRWRPERAEPAVAER
jgi:MFS family permease